MSPWILRLSIMCVAISGVMGAAWVSAQPPAATPPGTQPGPTSPPRLQPLRPRPKPLNAGVPITGVNPKGQASKVPVKDPVADSQSKPTDKGGVAKPTGPARIVYDAYDKSSTAKTDADYLTIIEMVEDALQQGVGQEHQEYARRLKGWAHNKRGETLLEEKKGNLALVQFELAVELNPNHWKARQNRGVSYAEAGRVQDAIADFSRVIQLNPGYANAWFNRGELYYQQGDLSAAVRDYGQAIRRSSTDPVYYQVRGSAFHQLRQYDDALTDFNRAIELDANSAATRVYRGDTNTVLGRFEEAAEDYRQAIRLNDQLGRAYQSTAWLMATCPDQRYRDPSRAILAAKKAIELDGDKRYQYQDTLAAALAANGQFGEAVKVQQRTVELAPQSAARAVRDRLSLYEREQPYQMQARAARGQWQAAGRR